jgi:hypothetical protein
MADELSALQAWFAAQVDSGWEHRDGIEINTLDNPGWRVIIQLEGTSLEGMSFADVEENFAHETDWLRCWVAEERFQAAGGPLKLSRILRIFLDWAARQSRAD